MKLTLASKTALGDNAWAFTFMPERPLDWTAGQFIKVDLPHLVPDAKGTSRRFTIAAAPHEQTLTIATRLTGSTFKRALAELPAGGALDLLDTPAGDFIWRPAAYPHIFVGHGVGITPFYAIIKDRHHHRLPTNAHLLYTNRPGHRALFEDELIAWAAADPTFHVTFQTQPITPASLLAQFPNLAKRHVYVSGPKPLLALCLPPYNLPLSQLKQDNFPGYSADAY